MSNDLVEMARLAQHDERMSTGALYGDLADRIEELEAKLAQQDDLVQAAVAAALTEAAEQVRHISMCDSETCPLKAKCYRNPASGTKPSEHVQSWFWSAPGNGEDCDYYWPVKDRR